MMYYATWRAHGQYYESGPHDTKADCERDVFGRAYAPSRNEVSFWQMPRKSND